MNPGRPPTKFEDQVFDATRQIPRGKVTTYRELGLYIGCRSSQAIGQALKRNPFAPAVPCHRVVKSDLTIGGFHGSIEGECIDDKRRLLAEEGVAFSPSGQIAPDHHFSFERDS